MAEHTIFEGDYVVKGKNADGSAYQGRAAIHKVGETYTIKWLIGGDSFDSDDGRIEGDTLRFDFWEAVYQIKDNGILEGTWGDKGTEKLIPIREPEQPQVVVIEKKVRRKPVTILFLASDPSDLSRLRISQEYREIQDVLTRSAQRRSFKLENPQLALRPRDISQALLDYGPKIVHFAGHGTTEGTLCFENDPGTAQEVPVEALSALFAQFAGQVECVILNACYSDIQAIAISQHIRYVIGMKRAIGDQAAIAFAVGFYQGLYAGRTIEDAFQLGCVQIQLMSIPEHLTPMLLKKPGA